MPPEFLNDKKLAHEFLNELRAENDWRVASQVPERLKAWEDLRKLQNVRKISHLPVDIESLLPSLPSRNKISIIAVKKCGKAVIKHSRNFSKFTQNEGVQIFPIRKGVVNIGRGVVLKEVSLFVFVLTNPFICYLSLWVYVWLAHLPYFYQFFLCFAGVA